jgi:hypothetical protein
LNEKFEKFSFLKFELKFFVFEKNLAIPPEGNEKNEICHENLN